MKKTVSAALSGAMALALVVAFSSSALAQYNGDNDYGNNNKYSNGYSNNQGQRNNNQSENNGSGNGVLIGYLSCHISNGWGYVIGSERNVNCIYRPRHGQPELYDGSITAVGPSLGYLSSATMLWGVVAPSYNVRYGALAGNYAGAGANAAVDYGVGASALFGGFEHSIQLEPISVRGERGVNVALGIEDVALNYEGVAHTQSASR